MSLATPPALAVTTSRMSRKRARHMPATGTSMPGRARALPIKYRHEAVLLYGRSDADVDPREAPASQTNPGPSDAPFARGVGVVPIDERRRRTDGGSRALPPRESATRGPRPTTRSSTRTGASRVPRAARGGRRQSEGRSAEKGRHETAHHQSAARRGRNAVAPPRDPPPPAHSRQLAAEGGP